jgi:hypothetical protein
MMGAMARIMIGIAVVCSLTFGSGLANAAGSANKYIGASKCKTCHKKLGDQYAEWQKSSHSKAFQTLMGEKAIALAKAKGVAGPPSKAAECLKCHSTAAGVGAQGVEGKPLVDADGVQCESCHGPGSAYKKKKIMMDRDKAVAAGLIIPDEKTCIQCHNDKSPTWDPAKYKLASGTSAGFDFDQASKKISHPIPADVKGKSSAGAGGGEE